MNNHNNNKSEGNSVMSLDCTVNWLVKCHMDCGTLKKIWNCCHVQVVQQQLAKRFPLKLIDILIAGLQVRCRCNCPRSNPIWASNCYNRLLWTKMELGRNEAKRCSITPASHELSICNCHLPAAICNLPPADANRWAFNMPQNNSFSYSYCECSTTDDLLQLLRDNKCQMQNTHTPCCTSPLVSIVVALRSRSHSHSHHNYKNNICVSCFSLFFSLFLCLFCQ